MSDAASDLEQLLGDAACAMYLDLLFAGADEALRRTALHYSVLCGLGTRFFDVGGLYRVGLRRWTMP